MATRAGVVRVLRISGNIDAAAIRNEYFWKFAPSGCETIKR